MHTHRPRHFCEINVSLKTIDGSFRRVQRKNRNPKKSVHFLKYTFCSKPSLATVVRTRLVGSRGVSKEIKSINLQSSITGCRNFPSIASSYNLCQFNASVSYIKAYSPYRTNHNAVIPTTLYATISKHYEPLLLSSAKKTLNLIKHVKSDLLPSFQVVKNHQNIFRVL